MVQQLLHYSSTDSRPDLPDGERSNSHQDSHLRSPAEPGCNWPTSCWPIARVTRARGAGRTGVSAKTWYRGAARAIAEFSSLGVMVEKVPFRSAPGNPGA